MKSIKYLYGMGKVKIRQNLCWLLGHCVLPLMGFCLYCRRYKGGRLSKREALDRMWGKTVEILKEKTHEKKT